MVLQVYQDALTGFVRKYGQLHKTQLSYCASEAALSNASEPKEAVSLKGVSSCEMVPQVRACGLVAYISSAIRGETMHD